ANVGSAPGPLAEFGTVRSGIWPLARNLVIHPGRDSAMGANLKTACRSTWVGIGGLPQSRRPSPPPVASRVTIRALAPDFLARSIRYRMSSRLPVQYSW